MKTDDLIAMLAREPEPVGRARMPGKLAAALGIGTAASALLMVATLGVRPDLERVAQLGMFYVKIAFPALLGLAALCVYWRAAHPGRRLGAAPAGVVLPIIAMAIFAVVVLVGASPEERGTLIFGATWKTCPFNIAMLSLPILVATIAVMKRLAPTSPALAGAACGLVAGASAAVVYALHCPEMSAPFIALWYLLGMLLPAAAGAIAGDRLFRW